MSMKQLIVSILAVFYLGASTGTTVDIHYCMGKLVDWTITHQESKACGSCGMEKKGTDNGCCKDEQKFFKNTDDQKTAGHTIQLIQLAAADLPSTHSLINEPQGATIVEELPRANAPPSPGDTPIYLRNRVFLI
jgi:hypothetical protein